MKRFALFIAFLLLAGATVWLLISPFLSETNSGLTGLSIIIGLIFCYVLCKWTKYAIAIYKIKLEEKKKMKKEEK